MKINICPYCNDEVINNNCVKPDHEFWESGRSPDFWYIVNKDFQIYIDTYSILDNRNGKEYIVFDKKISVNEAGVILKKFLKLKAFL